MPKEKPAPDTELDLALKAASQVRAALERLRGKRGELEAESRRLSSRNSYLLNLPIRRDDAKAFVLSTIDLIGSNFPKRNYWSSIFEKFAFPQRGYSPDHGQPSRRYRPLCIKDVDDATSSGVSVLGFGTETFLTGKTTAWAPWDVDSMYFFFGDIIKKKIEEHFDDFFPDYADDSAKVAGRRRVPADFEHYANAPAADLQSSVSDRRAEIESNKKLIASLNEEIEAIDSNLAQLEAEPAA